MKLRLRIFLSVLIYFILVVPIAQSQNYFHCTLETLSKEISQRKNRVVEFRKIAEWGKAHGGVRIWAAGGTAAGLAHYIKIDLEREWNHAHQILSSIPDKRFGYAYIDIYRSTQDADLVIDGDENTAQELENYLKQEFEYLKGSKEIWEVRLLHHSRGSGAGEKEALLGNTDFSNQNTDSHSTGMLELTNPPPGESEVRDLLDWNNQYNPQFLLDVVDGQLHFIQNPHHRETKRFLNGQNPEILSVIRYYTKAFQYGLSMRDEDRPRLDAIIRDFDPVHPAHCNDYGIHLISKNAFKLFWHSRDVERSWDVLEKTGLRKKLLAFTEHHSRKGISIWLDKTPLRSTLLGSGSIIEIPGTDYHPSFKTASELGITTVSHEANTFIAYESITFSLHGKLNAFISRKNHPDERAMYGDGFYARVGRKGAIGSGFTIRSQVNPNAIEGIDFFVPNLQSIDFVIFRNATALTVEDDGFEISAENYLKLLLGNEIGKDDLGIQKKISYKIASQLSDLPLDEQKKLQLRMQNELTEIMQQYSGEKQYRDAPDRLGRLCLTLKIWPGKLTELAPILSLTEFIPFLDHVKKSMNRYSGDSHTLLKIIVLLIPRLKLTATPVEEDRFWQLVNAAIFEKSLGDQHLLALVRTWQKIHPPIPPPFPTSALLKLYQIYRVEDLMTGFEEGILPTIPASEENSETLYQFLTHLLHTTPVLNTPHIRGYSTLVELWLKQPGSLEHPEFTEKLLSRLPEWNWVDLILRPSIVQLPNWEQLLQFGLEKSANREALLSPLTYNNRLKFCPRKDVLDRLMTQQIETRVLKNEDLKEFFLSTQWLYEQPRLMEWLEKIVHFKNFSKIVNFSSMQNILYLVEILSDERIVRSPRWPSLVQNFRARVVEMPSHQQWKYLQILEEELKKLDHCDHLLKQHH